jgi:3-oxoacyl-(acyl-carrier-protein) synthase
MSVRPIAAFEDNREITYALSNSFGFGGNCTSLVFAAVR